MKIQFGEWTPDVAEPLTEAAAKALNVIPLSDGSYRSMFNFAQLSASGTTTNPIRGAFSAQAGEITHDFYGDDAKLYRIDETNLIVTDESGGVYTTPADTFWDFTQYGNFVIAVNGGVSGADTPQVWQLSGPASTTFGNLGGSPPKAETITTVRDFVVVGNTYDATDGVQEGRVRWSGFGQHESWAVDPATQADLQDLKTSSGPVRRVLGGHNCFVVCDKSVYLMSYEGPPTAFRFDEIAPGIGTAHPHSCVRVGDTIFFYSHGGFIAMGSNGIPQWIGKNKVDLTMRQRLETVKADRSDNSVYKSMIGCYSPRDQTIAWLYGNVIGSTNTADYTGVGIMYSIETNRWVEFQTGVENAAYIYTSKIDPDVGEGLYYVGASNKDLFGVNSAGAALDWELETGDLQLGRDRSFITKIRPIMQDTISLTTPVLKIGTRDDFTAIGATALGSAESWNANGWWDVRSEGRYHRFNIGDDALSIQRIRGLDIEQIVDSGRV